VRHDEKMTVYVTADELLDLEDARLALRREHGLAVDRGRMVREAIAIVLADLEEQGYDSLLVQRLVDSEQLDAEQLDQIRRALKKKDR